MSVLFKSIFIVLSLLWAAFSWPYAALAEEADNLSDEAKKPMAEKVYQVAVDEHLPPFSYINEAGELTGFSVELFRRIAEAQQIEVAFHPMNLYEAERALEEGTVDAVIGMKYSVERSERFRFSESYFTTTDVMVIPSEAANEINSLAGLRGKTIVMQEDPVSFELLLNVRRVEFQLALNAKDSFQFLLMDRADAWLTNKRTAEFYLDQSGERENYRILEHISVPSDFAVAVRQGERDLLQLVNESLADMQTNGDYQRLYTQWFGLHPDSQLREMRNWIIFLSIVIGCAAIILIVIYLWNKRLKKEVAKRTSALAEANVKLEQQQKALSQADAFKTQIIHHLYYGILTFNKELQVTSLNERAKELLGFGRDELLEPADILGTPLIAKIVREYTEHVESNQQPAILSEEIEIEVNEETRYILYRAIPLQEGEEEKSGFLITLADRSEAKMLEKKLATQEKMRALGQLVAGVAHEIRNPLTSMKTFIDLLPYKYEDVRFREELIKHVPEALRRMNKIVESLLDYARPKFPKKKMLGAGRFIQSVVAIIEPTMKKQQVRLSLDIEQDDPIVCDPDQLKQVLLNLLLNALDAMEEAEEKKLTISTERKDDITFVHVTDSGMGMDKEDISHIFEPFYTTKPHGVGLGLTLCYQWIKENDGDMQIESMKGKGTTFTIALPAKWEEENE
ncbi:transporter substrate-binding domain-containing protein [Bacillus thermotolerans]|uniref:transporter substrate-binding domain-containing protein n=1 Tax=Bacillus thermotolerans TaxID=1221996 RepID=UPI00057C3F7D|nr:transporter substrate-binding domain-containing protein [Bacillus thermotolerans]KKB38274.1 Sensor histidine kinase [Bacillus thermotolerans]KKB44258.1 Sensor histidine kinase [Bacillus thermotolerans]